MLNEEDILDMYIKAGFTREQAVLLNDVAASLIFSVKAIINIEVDKKFGEAMVKGLRSNN